MAKPQKDGEDFEKAIAALFSAANFHVQQNVQAGGYEFDIIATKAIYAGFELRIAIECKYRTAQCGGEDVNKFAAAFRNMQMSQRFTHGIVVTNNRFSRGAYGAAADSPMIKLLTVATLEDELVGARLYLDGAARAYKSHGHGKFIDLRATRHPVHDWNKSVMVDSVVDYCINSFRSSPHHFIFLLGDFGSGKTTAAERIHSNLTQAFLANGEPAAGKEEIFPVILYLRTLQTFDTDEAFIEAQLRLSAPDLNVNLIARMEARGPLLFIMDGFDEVATNTVEQDRMQSLSRVMRIASRASHLLITSRPGQFHNIDGINELVGKLTARDFNRPSRFMRDVLVSDRAIEQKMQSIWKASGGSSHHDGYRVFAPDDTSVLYLQPLSPADVLTYLEPASEKLEAIYKMSVSEIVEILDGIYDLSDLMSKPLLLEILESLLLNGDLDLNDPNLEVGPTGLYETYVRRHLDRDWGTRQYLTRDERLAFARAAAIVMLEAGGSLEAGYASIEHIVRTGGASFAAAQREELLRQMPRVVADVSICAFINLTIHDRIEFAHKSFMEYFVADVIMSQLPLGRPIPYLRQNLNYEILYFMGSYCILRGRYFFDLIEHLNATGTGESEDYRTNIRIALLLARRKSEGAQFVDIRFDIIKIIKKEFVDCQFGNFHLSHATIARTSFERCRFQSVSLRGELEKLSFVDCSGTLTLGDALLSSHIESCSTLKLEGGHAGLRIVGGDWSVSTINIGNKLVEIDDVRIAGCDLAPVNGSEWRLSGCTIDDTAIELGVGIAATIVLTRCTLGAVRLRKPQIPAASYREHRDQLGQCSGILFVIDPARESGDLFVSKDKGPIYIGWKIRGALLVMTSEFLSAYETHAPAIRDIMAREDRAQRFAAWAAKNLHLHDLPSPFLYRR